MSSGRGQGVSEQTETHAPTVDDLQKIADAAQWSSSQPIGERMALQALSWFPSGPVARAFVLDPAPVSLLCGPWGSGKTTALFVKALLCSCAVPPSPVDGVRYARGAVVRDTYRNLETNTIPSWHERFPKEMGKWKGGSGGEPAAHVLDFSLEDDTPLHLEVLFVAIGDHNVKQFCDGLQVNWCAMNGMDELPDELIGYMRPRTGRWPPPQHRPADWKKYVRFWRKIMADMNAPELDNHTVRDFVTTPLPNHKIFIQPSGLTPEAENMDNLPDGYYQDLAAGKEDWWVARFIENKFGYSRSGKPVYTQFNPAVHVSKKTLVYDPKRTLVIGIDAQRDCCAVAMQKKFSGRSEWLREFIPPERTGAKQFGSWLAKELPVFFPEIGDFVFVLDPSAFDPNGMDDDFTWAEVFGRSFGLGDEWASYVMPAPTNNLEPRITAVGAVIAETDGFILDQEGCAVLIRAFMSGYRFGDTKSFGDEALTQVPVKNQWSHVMEAGQYGQLRLSNFQRLKGRKPRHRHQSLSANFDPLAAD